MTKTMVSEGRRTLAHLREQLEPILEILLSDRPMLKAYLDSKPRTCGKASCRCAQGEKHPAWVVRIPEAGHPRSKSISESTFRRLEPLAQEYRRFRQAAAGWRRRVREVEAALRKIEEGRLVDLETKLGEENGK